MRILVVEDERRLADTLVDLISGNNHLVDAVYDGESGLDSAMSGIYDAVILDVMLPRLGGFEVVRQMRREGLHTPVLMLTAKNELESRVKGLDLGADYYLTKPFETAELMACLRAILRRKGEVLPEELRFGDLALSPSSSALSCGSRSVRLGAKELELMRLLMVNREILLPKETILLKVWGYESEAEGNVVEVYMSFLRKKLSHIKSTVKITAVRMVGYHLEGSDDKKAAPQVRAHYDVHCRRHSAGCFYRRFAHHPNQHRAQQRYGAAPVNFRGTLWRRLRPPRGHPEQSGYAHPHYLN